MNWSLTHIQTADQFLNDGDDDEALTSAKTFTTSSVRQCQNSQINSELKIHKCITKTAVFKLHGD